MPGMDFQIHYKTKTEEPVTFTGPEYLNHAIEKETTVKNVTFRQDASATVKNFHAKWTIDGAQNGLHVEKIDDQTMKPLQGAELQVINLQTGATITLTTDANGEAIFKNLQPGNYGLQEIKAPSGYKINNQLYLFNVNKDYKVSGFGNSQDRSFNGKPIVTDTKEKSLKPVPIKSSSSSSMSSKASSSKRSLIKSSSQKSEVVNSKSSITNSSSERISTINSSKSISSMTSNKILLISKNNSVSSIAS